MPANKNKLLRIQTILTMLRKCSYPNFTSFMAEMRRQDPAGAYNLSSKTFTRDIADLKEEFGAPVRYDSSRKGFYLTNTEWYNEDLMVEPFEMKAALLGERVASGIFPEPMRGEISRAVSSLLMKNETGMAEGVEIENFQVLNPKYLPVIRPEIFLTAYNAWEQHHYLKLDYHNGSGRRVAEKLFEPHIFAWNGGLWYLKGRLHRDGGKLYDPPRIQVLALHRIEKAEMLGGSPFDSAPEIIAATKKNGLFDFERIPEVVIRYEKPFDRVMTERFSGHPGAVTEHTADSVTIRLENVAEYEALQLFLFACGHARVIQPESLIEKVRKIAQTILAAHSGK